jgi:hypothetical protein
MQKKMQFKGTAGIKGIDEKPRKVSSAIGAGRISFATKALP